MRIIDVSICGFRNLENIELTFSPQVNLVLGRNGEGKTNFLEALNFFALGRSHRSSKNEELVAFDQESLHVALQIEDSSFGTIKCEYGLEKSGSKRLKIDNEILKRRAELVGKLVTVFFNPNSIDLIRGGPKERRNFCDQGMAELDPLFLSHLGALQKTLKQKSILLRNYKKGFVNPAGAREELSVWNRELSVHAAHVCVGRAEYTRLAAPFANDRHKLLVDNELSFEFLYNPNLKCFKKILPELSEISISKEDLTEEIFKEIDYISDLEIQRGRPVTGPQQDDFLVCVNGIDLRTFGSQGETRTAAISLILARSDVLYLQRKIRPVLFFDDIFSELDRDRCQRLQEMSIRDHQVFIATARTEDIAGWNPEYVKAWNVADGSLTEVDQKS